jgi:seryl-tRNA synthetase
MGFAMLDPVLFRNKLAELPNCCCLPRAASRSMSPGSKRSKPNASSIQTRTQELQNLRNTRSKAIGIAKGKGEDTSALMAEVASIGDELKASEARLARSANGHRDVVPEYPEPSACFSADRQRTSMAMPSSIAGARRGHLHSRRKIMSISVPARAGSMPKRPRRLSGARFTILRGELARLHRALAQFMLDLHTGTHGYVETNVPLMVNAASMRGTGQLPKFEEDLFATAGDDRRYLIPTSEVPLTNIVRDEIVSAESLPLAHDRPFDVLPRRGRFGRARHARHDPPAPVRESRAGQRSPRRRRATTNTSA